MSDDIQRALDMNKRIGEPMEPQVKVEFFTNDMVRGDATEFLPRTYGFSINKAVEVFNRVLSTKAVRVYGNKLESGLWRFNEQPSTYDTHSALVINAEPIVKESEERALLREALKKRFYCQHDKDCDWEERARKLLDKPEPKR